MRRGQRKRKVRRKEARVLPLVVGALVLLGIVTVGKMLVGSEGTGESSAEPRIVQKTVRKVHKQQKKQPVETHLAPDEKTDEPQSPQPPQPQPVVRPDTPKSEEGFDPGQGQIADVRTPGGETDTEQRDEETPRVSVRETDEETDEPDEPTKEQEVAAEEEKHEPRRISKYHPARCSNSVYSLSEAARAGDVELVRKRLKEGYPVCIRNEAGMTPLHLAVQNGRTAAARLLISRGADVLTKDKQGRLPIDLTEDEEIKALLKEAEKVRMKEIEVFSDIRRGETKKLREMLAHGMSPDVLWNDGETCILSEAVYCQNKEAVRILLKAGAKTTIRGPGGKTPLHAAATGGDGEIVQMLLKAGADPMGGSGNGFTALHEAVWSGREDAVKALLPYYKKVNFSPTMWYGTPIGMAINQGRANIVQEILKAGLNVNSPMFEEPLLVTAAKAGNVEIVKMLLKAHARRDAKDAHGNVAADYASGEVARLLK